MSLLGNSTLCPDWQWIQDGFGTCPTDAIGVAGVFVGLSSIVFWIFAQAPQIYMNYKLGNADSLAPLFLGQWLLGDSCNLVGALLTHQLPTQIYTAIYFCCVDVILCGQYIFYFIRERRRNRYQLVSKGNVASVAELFSLLFVFSASSVLLSSSILSSAVVGQDALVRLNPGGRTLKESPFDQGEMNTIGYCIGIVSALLYLGSRVPQIVKNYQRKSTGGLSLAMFLMAVMGNLTYAASVFMQGTSADFLINKLPWLAGSVGTLCFDFTIFFQFWYYDKGRNAENPENKALLSTSESLDHFDSFNGSKPTKPVNFGSMTL